MMSRQNVLLFLREDADKRQKEIAVRLGKQRSLLNEVQQKLQLLENYLQQYRNQAIAAETSGILGAQALDTRNLFINWSRSCRFRRKMPYVNSKV
jgi:hypothetical protein